MPPMRHPVRAARRPSLRLTVLAIVVGLALAIQPGSAAVKVRVELDKTFDFKPLRTWAWDPRGTGDVMVARTQDDDPAVIKKRAEPIIMEAVKTETARRGLTLTTGTPDFTLNYFLLLTVGTWRQEMGQFLPSVTNWGIPPFAPATTAIESIEQGALVIDLTARGKLVWRGIAEADIKLELDDQKREALLREAVKKIIDRYPGKK